MQLNFFVTSRNPSAVCLRKKIKNYPALGKPKTKTKMLQVQTAKLGEIHLQKKNSTQKPPPRDNDLHADRNFKQNDH